MKSLTVVSTLAAIALAGCAGYGDTQYAKAECKVVPMTTVGAAGVRTSRVDSLAQRDAEFQLGSTDYRRKELAAKGLANNNVEEALRDCY
jgi:hypothetical protein